MFNEDFWGSLDLVFNALDNVTARLFVDEKCVFFGIPLIDSGTLGTKGSVQVILPHLTESYGASSDPAQKEIPVCTLKYYPHAIEHTLQWARDMFESLFSVAPEVIQKMKATTTALSPSEKAAAARLILPSDGDCLQWARFLWEDCFANDIKQLLHHFPADSVNSQGMPFWSPPRRLPVPLTFDPEDEDTRTFVHAAALLRAMAFGINMQVSDMTNESMLAVDVPEFVPKEDVTIPEDETLVVEDQGHWDRKKMEVFLEHLRSSGIHDDVIQSLPFEKDDDSNHHMEFVHSAANLRARNYSIQVTDRREAKMIAGRIIPALATTTSAVAGLACVEMEKYFACATKLEVSVFKNSFVNLSLPLFTFSEPLAPQKNDFLGKEWTQWDFFTLQGGEGLAIGSIIAQLREREGISVVMMSYAVTLLYTSYMEEKKRERRLQMTCGEAVEEATGRKLTAKILEIALAAEDDEGNSLDVPCLKLRL